jgi:hypothetical protein
MNDNLRNNVGRSASRTTWETNDGLECHVEKYGNRTQKEYLYEDAANCAYAVAKGTTDDNIDTHRKMRHNQRQGSQEMDL